MRPCVTLGEGVGSCHTLGELAFDAGIRLAVDERREVPLGLEQFGVGERVGGGGQRTREVSRTAEVDLIALASWQSCLGA